MEGIPLKEPGKFSSGERKEQGLWTPSTKKRRGRKLKGFFIKGRKEEHFPLFRV